ncbi:MAG: hypothetical protein LBU36_00285 [Clostridiales bacterium]|jgi:hypothetical protein|nr:hypothetical protein [Clostridiales bacterium]
MNNIEINEITITNQNAAAEPFAEGGGCLAFTGNACGGACISLNPIGTVCGLGC